ncbi:hypothetical protein SDC9_172088 [bioreactor metagenome]|uniref:Uncharacterized protein n=1 Tax=bioreactor metagenome TaxID=1076179 RepID=A0A645GEW5_9ZZZZ
MIKTSHLFCIMFHNCISAEGYLTIAGNSRFSLMTYSNNCCSMKQPKPPPMLADVHAYRLTLTYPFLCTYPTDDQKNKHFPASPVQKINRLRFLVNVQQTYILVFVD